MLKDNTSTRIKIIMKEHNLRQVNILEKAKPFCIQYGVKLNKSDLSQYVSGIVEQGQDKLTILAKALGVNEVWLMGYDVPRILNTNAENIINMNLSEQEKEIIINFRKADLFDKAIILKTLHINDAVEELRAAHNTSNEEEPL